MKKVMLVFGTRPEAIKMCPLVNELKQHDTIETVVCVTGQHKEMLDQVLDVFRVVPDYNLGIMKANQTLFTITTSILEKIQPVLEEEKPDIVLVHGDTTTTFATALAAFYMGIKVGHVEAGLRTYNLQSPYPEEFNRQATSPSTKACSSFAASYSEFSERSPYERAILIRSTTSGRRTNFNSSNSCSNFSFSARVIGYVFSAIILLFLLFE